MNIITRILKSIFTKSDETDDEVDYSNDDKLAEVSKMYERGKRELRKHNQSYQSYDIELIPIFNEYERQKAYCIRFEFIPKEQNHRNLRSASWFKYGTWHTWTEIRNHCEKLASGKCIVCGKTSYDFQHIEPTKKITTNTEAHENWRYDDDTKIMRLYKISSLCFVCHQVSHINMHKKNPEKFDLLLKRYAQLNNVSVAQAQTDFEFAESEKKRREKIKYSLDMRFVNKFGLECEFDKFFDCHTQDFISFLELKFKQSDKKEDEERDD